MKLNDIRSNLFSDIPQHYLKFKILFLLFNKKYKNNKIIK